MPVDEEMSGMTYHAARSSNYIFTPHLLCVVLCGFHSFSANTFSVCFFRYSSSRCLIPESDKAKIAAANKAALADPASAIARVATGMPLGI